MSKSGRHADTKYWAYESMMEEFEHLQECLLHDSIAWAQNRNSQQHRETILYYAAKLDGYRDALRAWPPSCIPPKILTEQNEGS